MVHLDFNGVVYCDEIGDHCHVCDFFGLLRMDAQCGNCPMTNFVDRYVDAKLDRGLWEELGLLCSKTKEDVASVTIGSQTTME